MSECVVLHWLYRMITTEAGRRLAEQWKAVFVEASAKQNEVCLLLILLGRTTSCSASDCTYFSVVWSVCLSVCRLSHSCTLLKPFNGFRCHLAATPVGSTDAFLDGVPDPQGKGRSGAEPPAQTCLSLWLTKKMICDSPRGSIDHRFRLLPNYFAPC